MSVLIFLENWEGKFKKLSFELVSYGTELARMAGYEAVILSIGRVGDEELQKLGKYGATKIYSLINDDLNFLDNQVYSALISRYAKEWGSKIILLSNNNTGKALAPRIAVRLKAGLGAGVNSLPSGTEPFVIHKRAYSGNVFANVRINSDIKVLTLTQNAFGLIESPSSPVVATISAEVSRDDIKTVVEDIQKQSGKILLTDADIVVSGGRGMKSPDNWGPLVELADLLGAATACSRPVSDEGWRSHEEHTGQTGKIIAPNLYIAIGISGATQHLAGISSSKYIAAINTDKDAPIFSAAQYGIIGDAQKVLPKLVEAVREMKNK